MVQNFLIRRPLAERLIAKLSKDDIMKQKLLHRSKDAFIRTKGSLKNGNRFSSFTHPIKG